MSMNSLNDLSKVYLEKIAEAKVEPPKERLKTDRNMFSIPKDEQAAAKERLLAKAKAKREKMTEAVKGADPEMRKAASAERRSGDKRLAPSKGKGYADQQKQSIAYMDKVTKKNKNVVGLVTKEALDPVGKEDADIDNDGDTDKSDKYLHKRRKAIGKAIAKKSVSEATKMGIHSPHEVPSKNLKGMVKKAVKRIDADNDGDVDKDDPKEKGMGEFVPSPDGKKKVRTSIGEGYSNWRQDLSEVMTDVEDNKQIKEKKVNNKVKINPDMKEAVEQLGGELIEMVELDEAVYGGEKKEPKDTRYTVTAADKKANTLAYQNYKKGDKRYKAADHLGEEVLDEKALSKQQQKFMGMVYAVKKGEMKSPSAAVAKAAAGMSKKAAKDFAKTKHKGLPEKKEVKEGATEAPMSPQELTLQKRKTAIDVQISKKRQQTLQKTGTQKMNEEESDRLKDKHLERGGMGARKDYDRPPAKKLSNAELGIKPGKTPVQKELEKKHGKGKSALDIVKAEIRAKHGKGSIK